MRRIEEWFIELPTEHRDKAQTNMHNDGNTNHIEVSSMSAALLYAFDWYDTEEGYDYWYNLYESYFAEKEQEQTEEQKL
jgi:hypothetical protein